MRPGTCSSAGEGCDCGKPGRCPGPRLAGPAAVGLPGAERGGTRPGGGIRVSVQCGEATGVRSGTGGHGLGRAGPVSAGALPDQCRPGAGRQSRPERQDADPATAWRGRYGPGTAAAGGPRAAGPATVQCGSWHPADQARPGGRCPAGRPADGAGAAVRRGTPDAERAAAGHRRLPAAAGPACTAPRRRWRLPRAVGTAADRRSGHRLHGDCGQRRAAAGGDSDRAAAGLRWQAPPGRPGHRPAPWATQNARIAAPAGQQTARPQRG